MSVAGLKDFAAVKYSNGLWIGGSKPTLHGNNKSCAAEVTLDGHKRGLCDTEICDQTQASIIQAPPHIKM